MAAGYFSCENDQLVKLENNLLTKIEADAVLALKSNVPANVENPSNPFDFVGYHHNKSLDVVRVNLKNVMNDNESISIRLNGQNLGGGAILKTRIDKTIGIIQNYWLQNVSNSIPSNPSRLFENVKSSYANLITDTNPTQLARKNTSTNRDYSKIFYTKIEKLERNNGLTPVEKSIDSLLLSKVLDCEDLNDFINLTKSFESAISTSNLPNSTKERQLIFLSIFLQSGYYWEQVSKDPSSEWHSVYGQIFSDVKDNGRVKLPKWLKWVIIGAADGLGGLAGSLVSSPVGAAVVGGIAGGVASGVAEDLLE